MSVVGCLFAVGLSAAAAAGLAGCSGPPLDPNNGAALDSAYGIPPGTYPKSVMQPDGLFINGLLPLPPNSGS
jgi:hypothetical protein